MGSSGSARMSILIHDGSAMYSCSTSGSEFSLTEHSNLLSLLLCSLGAVVSAVVASWILFSISIMYLALSLRARHVSVKFDKVQLIFAESTTLLGLSLSQKKPRTFDGRQIVINRQKESVLSGSMYRLTWVLSVSTRSNEDPCVVGMFNKEGTAIRIESALRSMYSTLHSRE